MNHYPSNLTDNQWQVIEKLLDVQVRKSKYSLRSIVNNYTPPISHASLSKKESGQPFSFAA
jgi:hypothetical protein